MSGYGTVTNDIHPLLSSAEVMVNLRKENERLRELVQDFYPFALGRAAKPWLAVRRDRMRELGVDFDG